MALARMFPCGGVALIIGLDDPPTTSGWRTTSALFEPRDADA